MNVDGIRGRLARGAILVACGLLVLGGSVQAEEPGAGTDAQQGQIILNPEPKFAEPAPVIRVHDTLSDLAPAAGGQPATGSVDAGAGCAAPDGWSVVVVRGTHAPETVRGHAVTIIPAGC